MTEGSAAALAARPGAERSRTPRVVVFVAHDLVVRSFFTTGALDGIEDLHVVASSDDVRYEQWKSVLEHHPGYLGTVPDPRPETERGTGLFNLDYRFLRRMLTVRYAKRSSTMGLKYRWMAPRKRRFFRAASLPGVRQALVAAVMRRTGLSPQVHALLERVQPDLVLIPTGVYDNLAWDAIRSAQALEIPTLAVVPNWDALSGKTGFPVRPDYLGVWGEQTARHAVEIHDFPRERIELLGAPQFESYVRHEPGSIPSPFPFPYVLFAGTSAPFDELTALGRLEDLIEREQLDLKVVYRPHPDRRRRNCPDFVDEAQFRHVVVDPQVRDRYLEQNERGRGAAGAFFPALDYYPALISNAAFVICPFSTMIVEAALLGRRVLVPAYDDGVHRNSPAMVRRYTHFEGLDEVPGIDLSDSLDELVAQFEALANGDSSPPPGLREGIRHYVYSDDRPFSERLGSYVERIAAARR